MTAPEVTREEAAEDTRQALRAWAQASRTDGHRIGVGEEVEWLIERADRVARTVVALYDRLSAERAQGSAHAQWLRADRDQQAANFESALAMTEVMQQCIDRLRNGWRPWWGNVGGCSEPGWHWCVPDHDGAPERTPEPMTPEQAAVMGL